MAGFRFDLAGRVALVTGASSGLGRRFATVLAASGARVVLAARRTDLLHDLAQEIADGGGEALPVAMDVTDEASVNAAYDAAQVRFGVVDTVVANAGLNLAGSALGLDAAKFDQMVAVNLRGVFLTAREGARRMVAAGSSERGDGRITLISSITAHQPGSGIATYCATKAAVAQLGRALAKDWAGKGINVNVLCPGYVETELNADIWETPAGEALLAGFPRRRVMSADALDPMLLYLSSDTSAQTTGSVLTVDDGQTL
jgi:NAD(P)-dependent dehydrogenase (short-subunit alcohol dehydrogenase family)